MDEGPNYSKVTNPTALANNAIKSISFQEPQQAIQDALRHLLTLIQEQQASTHELNSQCNGISTRIDALEQKHVDDRQVQRAKQEEQKKQLQEEFQQRYGAQIDNLVERLVSSEKDNHDLREEMKNMDSRYGQELSAMRDTLNLLSHNLGFSPGDDGDRDGDDGDGSEKEQKDWETATEIAEMEKNHRVQGGKIKVTHSKQLSSTIQSKLRDRGVGLLVEHEDIREDVDDGSVDHPDKEKKHPGETDERSLTVSAATSSEKGAIVGDDRILTKPLDEAADETNEDDASINAEDIANDKTLPTALLRPDAGQGSTNNTAVSKQSPARPNQMNSASHQSSTAVFNASKTKLAFHDTLVSRLERLEGTYDEILRKHHNGNSNSALTVECESATSTGNESESSNNNAMKENILELEMEILALKNRVDSTDAFLDGCIDASNKTEEKSSDNSSPAPAPAPITLSSILQDQNKITQKNIEETNQRVDALSMELSSRLAQNELQLSQQSRGQSDFSPAKVGMDKTHSHGNLVDDAVVSDLEQKMRLLSDRLDDQEAKLEAQKSRNLPAVSTDDGWKNQVDKSLLRLEKEKADRSHLDSTVASLENKCNTKYDALADTIRQLREDGLATSSDSASDANFGTGSVSEASDGDDGRLEEALASIEAAQTTMGSLQNELERLISKLDDKPSCDQVKALLGSVESTYKDRFATHEALQSAIGDIHQGLKQKMTRSDVSNIVSKSIEKARLGLMEEKDSLMIGRAPYRCIGCNSLFPGVSNSIATKVNHNALPTPSIGFGRSLHAKRYFHVREDGDKRGRGGGGGGVIRTRRPRHSAGTIYARR